MNLLWTLTWGPHPTSECGQLLRLQAPVVRILLVGLPRQEGDPETHIYSRKTDLPRCSSHWTLWLAAPVFLPSCPFFNAMEGRGAPSFPHPHVIQLHSLTLGSAALQGSGGGFLFLAGRGLLPSGPCCDSK